MLRAVKAPPSLWLRIKSSLWLLLDCRCALTYSESGCRCLEFASHAGALHELLSDQAICSHAVAQYLAKSQKGFRTQVLCLCDVSHWRLGERRG